MSKTFFQEIVVWREENENTFYRYRILQNLKTGKYSLFGCNHIHRHEYDNVSISNHHEFAFRQSLFAGGLENIDESEMFDSIEESIAHLDNEA
jgi:hypothetical protein